MATLQDIAKQAGIPDGVFNVVNGDKEAVDELLRDKRIQALSFVGSTPIAEHIYTTGTANGKAHISRSHFEVVSRRKTPVMQPMAPLAFLSSSTGMGIHSTPRDS